MQKKLLFSLIFNAIFLIAFFHHRFEKPQTLALVEPVSIEKTLGKMQRDNFSTNVERLLDFTHLEGGVRMCDLSLSLLVTAFDFDGLDEMDFKVKKTNICIKERTYPLFLGLKSEEIQALHQYAKRCKYPLTQQGFLKKLQTKVANDPEFLASLFFKPKFAALKYLFPNLPPGLFVELLKELSSEFIEKSYYTIQQNTDVPALRKSILYHALFQEKSSFAAYFLALEEPEFVLNHFSDDQIMFLLNMFHTKMPNLSFFLYKLALSNRSEEVCRAAYYLYCKMLGLEYDAEHLVKLHANYLVHFVSKGETIEQIAENYRVPISYLKKVNRVEDQLPRVLFIPKDPHHL